MPETLLVVDDQQSIRFSLSRYFQRQGYNVLTANDGAAAIECCETVPVDLVLLDLLLPDIHGIEVLKRIKRIKPAMSVIIITGHGDIESVVSAMKLKADDFVLKPFDMKQLDALIENCLAAYRMSFQMEYLKRKAAAHPSLEHMHIPNEIANAVHLLSENECLNVLLLGETGTGKSMLAALIHEAGSSTGQFVDINCAGLSAGLLESELFGHERGAFTDAKVEKHGLFEVAHRGSIFLDEIGDMPVSVQAKVLKAIDAKSFRRVGSTKSIQVETRIMAATNVDLEQAVKQKQFREDLFFRLSVMPVTLPPLREQKERILQLAHSFLGEFSQHYRKEVHAFSTEAEGMLQYYAWPGNIRELRNVIERAALLCEGDCISAQHLPGNMRSTRQISSVRPGDDWSLQTCERRHIATVLKLCGNNRTKAAKLLNIHRATLLRKIQHYRM